MYNNCQSERYEINYNNDRYYEILQNHKLSTNYYNDNNKLNNNKLKNKNKLEKNKSTSMDKVSENNNSYSYESGHTNYMNNYNEEDLDIELDSVSTKIPINDFYIDNKEKNNVYENSEEKYKYKKINNHNKNSFKTCSPLIRKKKSKIQRNTSYDNLNTHALGSDVKNNHINKYNIINREKRNITNINIINNNKELNTFNEINDNNLNNKTEYECYRNINNKLKDKNTFDDEIRLFRFNNFL